MNNTKICLKIKQCEICNKPFDDLAKLQRHISYMHKDVMTAEQYYKTVLHIMPNKCPVCGENTDFVSFTSGYKTLCNKRSCNVAYTNPMVLSSYMYHGCSEEEARKKLSEYQQANANKVKRTAEYYDKCFSNRIGFWIAKGFSEEDAKKKVTERQNTTSLDAFQKVYGEEGGLIAFENRKMKYRKTWNAHSNEEKEKINRSRGKTFKELVNLYGENKASEIIAKRFHKIGCVSKMEKEIVNEIKKRFPNAKTQLRIKNELGKFYYYDCVIDGVIIEVNGDYWHANPAIYEPNSKMYSGLLAEEIWYFDECKKTTAEKAGYMIFYIWENDYIQHKEETLNKAIKEIYAFKNN